MIKISLLLIVPVIPFHYESPHLGLHYLQIELNIQSNLDYSKCQGPPDFLRIIGTSNFRNRYFSEMFGSFCSVLIFDCISIKWRARYHIEPLKIKQNKAI